MNLKMRKCLIINDRILRFMGRIAATLAARFWGRHEITPVPKLAIEK